MFPDTLARLQQKLGRPLPPKDRGSIAHLNDVPAELVAEAKGLGDEDLAQTLIAYYMTPGHKRYLTAFVHDVVLGMTPPHLWRRGGVLVPALNVGEQLTTEPSRLLALIGGAFDVRITPRLADWEAGVSWVGSPARPRPEADYLTPVPPGTANVLNPKIEPVSDATVAIRRWIAARLAAVLRSVERLDSVSDPSTIGANLPPYESWSADARAALAALLRERRELSRATNEIPGFRGPDDWYRAG